MSTSASGVVRLDATPTGRPVLEALEFLRKTEKPGGRLHSGDPPTAFVLGPGLRRDAHAKAEKITGWLHTAPSHFSSFEELSWTGVGLKGEMVGVQGMAPQDCFATA